MHSHTMECPADTYVAAKSMDNALPYRRMHTYTVSHRKVRLNTSILKLRLQATLEFSTFEPPLRFGVW